MSSGLENRRSFASLTFNLKNDYNDNHYKAIGKLAVFMSYRSG